MKKILWLLLVFSSLALTCRHEKNPEVDVSQIPVNVQIIRFDRMFYGAPPEKLARLKREFPQLFPQNIADSLWIQKMQDSLNLDLKTQVDSVYPDNAFIRKETENLFRHVKYYFPGFEPPRIITLYSDWDYTKRAYYTDTVAYLFLDNFLGSNNRIYNGIPLYIRQTMTPQHLAPALAEEIAVARTPFPKTRDFLSKMIYYGKILYLQKAFLPKVPDSILMGYSAKKWNWARENEHNVWLYFLDNKLLFDTHPQLNARFLDLAPFSKFYTEVDNESAGMIGRYIGWQIVREYMKHTNANIPEMLQTPAQEIFRKSKYKP